MKKPNGNLVIALLSNYAAMLEEQLEEALDDSDEYLRQLKLSMHANMRKRKQLKVAYGPKRGALGPGGEQQ